MSVELLGLATARPDVALSQAAAADVAVANCCSNEHEARLLRALYRKTGINSRGIALLPAEARDDPRAALLRFYAPASGCRDTRGGRGPTTAERMEKYAALAPPLAAAACDGALRDASISGAAITHLVVVSCTGFAAPGVEHVLIERVGLDRGVRRTSIGFMGCHGALNGLQAADAIVRADPAARVLLCAIELCSLHFQYGWHRDGVVGNALFADGAAAAVVGSAGGDAWSVVDTASRLIPNTAGEMTWTIGDHGFVMTLSARVPRTLADHLRPWLDDWLAGHGLTPADIGAWAIHAGGPRIVRAVSERLGVDASSTRTAREVLTECGNMSSATVFFILDRLRRENAPLPCVALSFGPGLVVEAVLFDRA